MLRCMWCRSEATVHIPDVGEWCSWHAFSLVEDWPAKRFAEIEMQGPRRLSIPVVERVA